MKPMPSCSTSSIYGTDSADEQKQMSGLEFVQGLADGYLGTEGHPSQSGWHSAWQSRSHNARQLRGLAIQSTLEKGVGSTTLEFKISFVRPITPETGPIKAEGT